MQSGNQIPDKSLLRTIVQKLSQRGNGSQMKVTPTVRGGDVTLSGTLSFEHQRRFILRIASSILGVRRVIDQMRVVAKKKSWN